MLLETLAAVGTLGALGVGGAGLRYLWRVASGEDSQRQHIERLQQIAATRDIGIALAQASAPPQMPEHYTDSRRWHLHLTGGSPRAAALPNGVRDAGETPAPVVPSFDELLANGRIGQGQPLLLGFSGGEGIWGGWDDLYSSAIGGLSGSGKSWAAPMPWGCLLRVP
jgi:hypothetical protein